MKPLAPLIKTLLIEPAFLSVVLGLIPWSVLRLEGRSLAAPTHWLQWAGLAPAVLGCAVVAWCVKDFIVRGRGTPAPFDPPTRLVVHGLYRWVRNPMYVGFFLIWIGEALWCASWGVLAYALAAMAAAHAFVTRHEEPSLRRRFGEEYEQYMKSVPRWLPRPPSRRA